MKAGKNVTDPPQQKLTRYFAKGKATGSECFN